MKIFYPFHFHFLIIITITAQIHIFTQTPSHHGKKNTIHSVQVLQREAVAETGKEWLIIIL